MEIIDTSKELKKRIDEDLEWLKSKVDVESKEFKHIESCLLWLKKFYK